MPTYGEGTYGLPGASYARLRELVLARDPTCRLRIRGCMGVSSQVSHIVPLYEGGTNQLSNLRGLCSNCDRAQPFLRIRQAREAEHNPPTQSKDPKNPKTHCRRGHLFDEANTYIRPNGARLCRACTRANKNVEKKPRRASKHTPKTHCRRGHLLDEANTYVQPSGTKVCRECIRYNRENRQKNEGGGRPLATHCPKGHPYDEENTYYPPDGSNRQCRACRNLRSRTRAKPCAECGGPKPEGSRRARLCPTCREAASCAKGHPYAEYGYVRRDGSRYCTECRRIGRSYPPRKE